MLAGLLRTIERLGLELAVRSAVQRDADRRA
jgi:hypothetical protein